MNNPNTVTNLIPISMASGLGHDCTTCPKCMQFDSGRKQCETSADVVMINVIFDDSGVVRPLNGSMIRYYCAPCWYQILMDATTIYSNATYIGSAIEADSEEGVYDLIKERVALTEEFSEIVHKILEKKHPDFLDDYAEEQEKKEEE